MKKIIATMQLILLAGLTGCCMLPAGDPPEGPIESNVPLAEYTERGAENFLVTSLAGFMLQNPQLRKSVSIEAEDGLGPMAIRVINGASRISSLRYEEDAPLVLRVRAENNRRRFQLYDPARETVLWQEQLVIKP